MTGADAMLVCRDCGGGTSSVVCPACGQPAVLQFAARANRSVYCSDCYRRHRANGVDT
jgi:CxxC-x17-CxxC domain-containing protein